MVVVHLFLNLRPEDFLHDVTPDILATRVGVTARQIHSGEVSLTQVAIAAHNGWGDVHAILASRFLQEVGGGLVAETARSEVDADPDAVRFVDKDINVVVAAADRAELLLRHVLEVRERLLAPERVIEQLVLDARLVVAAHAERNRADDFVHDLPDLGTNRRAGRVGANGKVAARDIESDPRNGNKIAIGDDTANRLRIPLVPIGTEHGTRPTHRHAAVDLHHRRLIVITKNTNAHSYSFYCSGGP